VNVRKILALLFFLLINSSFTVISGSVSATDLTADSWSTKTPMAHDRRGFGVVVVDGKIYAIGGYTEHIDGDGIFAHYSEQYFGTNERYDPISDTWTTLEPMPTNRTSFVTAEVSGKIYCIGNGPTEVYDPVTNKWSTKTPLPVASVWNSQGHVIDGKIYVTTYTDLYMYDPIKDSWTQKTGVPSPNTGYNEFYGFVSVVVDDKIVFVGLVEPVFPYTDPCQIKVTVYDPKTDIWSECKNGPKVTYRSGFMAAGATTGVYAPKNIYITGWKYENSESSSLPFTWVYDPVKDTWSTAKALSVFLQHHHVVNVEDVLYAIGDNNINEQYIPIGYKGTIFAPETPNSTLSTSEPFLTYPVLIYPVIAALVLTVGIVVGSLLHFVFRKRSYKTRFSL